MILFFVDKNFLFIYTQFYKLFVKIDFNYMTKQGSIYPEVQPGTTVKVHEKIIEVNAKGEEKQRVQVFEGVVIARKHGSSPGATITVRKIAKGGYGVEKIFPLHSPIIEKIEVVKLGKVRRSKLYFIRTQKYKIKEKQKK